MTTTSAQQGAPGSQTANVPTVVSDDTRGSRGGGGGGGGGRLIQRAEGKPLHCSTALIGLYSSTRLPHKPLIAKLSIAFPTVNADYSTTGFIGVNFGSCHYQYISVMTTYAAAIPI
ncbi:hypothetical protein J6590_104680 [Homalodisca vitripennis]|nr:hypothetical protein J6590_104680 [Homalodisca vitripennis]